MFVRAKVDTIFHHTINRRGRMMSEHTLTFSIYFFSKDFCRDESDGSDGYITEGFATMDVFEYDVDDSSDSEDLYSHGSSSGTDVRSMILLMDYQFLFTQKNYQNLGHGCSRR